MPINVKQDAINAVWAALEARTGFTSRVLPGNRLKTAEKDWTVREATRKTPVDFPNVRVFVSADNTNRPNAPMGHADCDYPIEGRLELEVRTVFDDLKDDHVMPLEAEIDAAMMGSIDLGLPFVRYVTTRGTRRAESSAVTKFTLRIVSRLTVVMETSVMRSEFA